MCKNFGEINFEVRPQQQRQIELGILSLASVNELIETDVYKRQEWERYVQ